MTGEVCRPCRLVGRRPDQQRTHERGAGRPEEKADVLPEPAGQEWTIWVSTERHCSTSSAMASVAADASKRRVGGCARRTRPSPVRRRGRGRRGRGRRLDRAAPWCRRSGWCDRDRGRLVRSGSPWQVSRSTTGVTPSAGTRPRIEERLAVGSELATAVWQWPGDDHAVRADQHAARRRRHPSRRPEAPRSRTTLSLADRLRARRPRTEGAAELANV